MRRSFVLTVGAAALAAGCSSMQEPVPAPEAQVSEPYMLIRPPDEVALVHMLEVVTYMPDGNDRFPVEQLNGVSEAESAASQELFKALVAESSPQAKAEFLADHSVDRDAPVEEWQQVRFFRSQEKCETTKVELQEVTKLHTKRVEPRSNMLLNDLQFHLLASSFALSECVPASSLPKITKS